MHKAFVIGLLTLFLLGSRGYGQEKEPQIGHMVFFKLKDNSKEAKNKLVSACNKYLSGHKGEVYYSAGVLAEEFNREVNVRDFDVALHVVFKNKAAHDTYQDHPRHLQFIKENKDNWANVRVFDSLIHPTARKSAPAIRNRRGITDLAPVIRPRD